MKVSIVDVGTQSLKHYIFEVDVSGKTLLHYKRYSDANLGEEHILSEAAIQRNLSLIQECLVRNKREGVSRLQLLGTEILRKAENAGHFLSALKKMSGHDIQVITQDQEARYLYEGFIGLVPDGLEFAAVNIGGGSTEVVVGNKRELGSFTKIPFGVKYLRNIFCKDGIMDWSALDVYLSKEVRVGPAPAVSAECLFVTGVLDFISEIGPHLNFQFEKNSISHHPIKIDLATYLSYLKVLRKTPLEQLQKWYPKDPGFAVNFTIGQSVYVAVAEKLSAKTIIPSNNDLTDGVIHQMLHGPLSLSELKKKLQ